MARSCRQELAMSPLVFMQPRDETALVAQSHKADSCGDRDRASVGSIQMRSQRTDQMY